jgi:hypothetical protein
MFDKRQLKVVGDKEKEMIKRSDEERKENRKDNNHLKKQKKHSPVSSCMITIATLQSSSLPMKSLTSSILFTLNLVIITDWVHDLVGELRALLFASRSLACLASSEQVIDLLSQLFAKQVIEQLSELFAEQIVGLLGKYFARQATVSRLVACSASSEQAGLLTFPGKLRAG